MVLGTVGSRVCARLPRLVCALWLIGAACSRSSLRAAAPSTREKESVSAVLDQAEVHGVSLQILAKENGCVLRAGPKDFPLQLTAPCFFLRREGKVQSFPYRDVNLNFVVIVAGTAVSDAHRKTWNLQEGEVCGEQSQAVLGSGSRVRLSKAIHQGGVYCKQRGVDQKEFWSFAHDPE